MLQSFIVWGERTMIVLIGASAMVLTALQASINAPRDAFRNCLKEAATKATDERVAADAFEAYLRNHCSSQLGNLKSALVSFNMKNGMARRTAASDADMTVDDYIASPVDKYKFMASLNAPATPATSTPVPTPAAASTQPPK